MRNAVVIIHGIGEQKPMDTLRGFVSSVTRGQDKSGGDIRYFSKPDELSNLFELRRLTTAVDEKAGRTKIDFFEYYWAYNNRDTKIQQVLSWTWNILLRWPWSLPKRVRIFHVVIWLILIGLISLALTSLSIANLTTNQPLWVTAIGSVAWGYICYRLTGTVGDAARYTSARPENITERQKIRKEGIALLKALHDAKADGVNKYEKIIVVGHSLGSIIGYDLIRHLWIQFHDQYKDNHPKDLVDFESKYAITQQPFDVPQYQADQATLFQRQSGDGNSWRIAHFITLGSPLTHATFLLANDSAELEQRMLERELPKSPPIAESINGEMRLTYQPDYPKPRRVLHHGAPFACTQWTNVYYQNDFVGGNLTEYFGLGINECKIKIRDSILNKYIPFLSHTRYWSDTRDLSQCKESLDILNRIIW